MTKKLIIKLESKNPPWEELLEDHLVWRDEYGWESTAQSLTYTLTGVAIIEYAQKKAGRPITLSTNKGQGLARRELVDRIRKRVEENPGAKMRLSLQDGRFFYVTWRCHDGLSVEAKSLTEVRDPKPDDWVELTIRLMTIGDIKEFK